jgi:hypothetical protein
MFRRSAVETLLTGKDAISSHAGGAFHSWKTSKRHPQRSPVLDLATRNTASNLVEMEMLLRRVPPAR